MSDLMVGFRQVVPARGFRWVHEPWDQIEGMPLPPGLSQPLPAPLEWFLTDGLPWGNPGRSRWYDPFARRQPGNAEGRDTTADSALFRTFAELKPERSAILVFANRYGGLGGDVGFTLKQRDPSTGGSFPSVGEPYSRWVSEIDAMHQAVGIWTLLRRAIELGHSSRGRDVRWYRQNLQRIINQRLDGRVTAGVFQDAQNTRLMMRVTPTSLIGALWLQCAQAIEGDVLHDRCKQCHTWFAIGAGNSRTDRRYCSNACRQKAARRRKLARGRDLA